MRISNPVCGPTLPQFHRGSVVLIVVFSNILGLLYISFNFDFSITHRQLLHCLLFTLVLLSLFNIYYSLFRFQENVQFLSHVWQ